MASLNVNFNEVNEKDAEGGGRVVPKDRYTLQIIEGEVKENSKKTGDLFEFKAEIIEGEFQGTKVFERINVSHNTSAIAQKIGQAQLKALALACGIDPNTLTDTDQLLYQPFMADLEIDTYQKNGDTKERNVIKKYIHAGNADVPPPEKAAPQQTAPNPSTARQTQNGGATPTTAARPNMPWKRTA